MKKVRISYMLLAAALLVSVLVGCSGSPGITTSAAMTATTTAVTKTTTTVVPTSAAATATTKTTSITEPGAGSRYYHYQEPVNVTTILAYNTNNGDKTTLENTWLMAWAGKVMNVWFDIEAVDSASVSERTTLLFASRNLPEVFFNWGGLNSLEKATLYGDQEGQLLPYNAFLNEDVMPNLTQAITEIPMISTVLTTLSGNIYFNPIIRENEEYSINTQGDLWYNRPWFEAVGYEQQPTTLSELLDALRLIKQTDPGGVGAENIVPIPGYQGSSISQYVLNALGFITSDTTGYGLLALRDGGLGEGSLICVPTDDVYIEYLRYMNTLYTEGLINPDFYTIDSTQWQAIIASGVCAVVYYPRMYSFVENWSDWTHAEPFTSEWNDSKMVSTNAGPAVINTQGLVVMSDACKNPEAVMRFTDIGYDREKTYLFSRGPQKGVDDTLGIVDGWYLAEDGVTFMYDDINGEDILKHLDYLSSLTPFQSHNLWERRTDGSAVALYSETDPVGYTNLQVIAHRNPYTVTKFTSSQFDTATNTDLKDLTTVLNDYLKAEVAKFITGTRPVTQEEFNAFRSDLQKLGIDRYTQLQLDAYKEQFMK